MIDFKLLPISFKQEYYLKTIWWWLQLEFFHEGALLMREIGEIFMQKVQGKKTQHIGTLILCIHLSASVLYF